MLFHEHANEGHKKDSYDVWYITHDYDYVKEEVDDK